MEEANYDELVRVMQNMGVEVYDEKDDEHGKRFTVGNPEYGDLIVFSFSTQGKFEAVFAP